MRREWLARKTAALEVAEARRVWARGRELSGKNLAEATAGSREVCPQAARPGRSSDAGPRTHTARRRVARRTKVLGEAMNCTTRHRCCCNALMRPNA
jgi:hypothetical protein